VLTVFTAAYATYGFNLPESVNARPDALPVGRIKDEASLLRASDGRASSPPLPLAVSPGQRPAADAPRAQVARADVPPTLTYKKSGKSVVTSEAKVGAAAGAADAGGLDSKGRHDRTMVHMMSAVGIMLTYFNPETKKCPSVHDVFMRMPSCGSMPPTAVTCRDPSQLEAQIAEDHTGPGSLNRPCHWDG